MYKKYNNDHRRERYDRSDRSDNRSERNDSTHHHAHTATKHSKGMILLKSSVFAMFIVLVVLIAAFEIVKHRKTSIIPSESTCNKVEKIKISGGVSSVQENGAVLVVVSKTSDDKQEIVRIDARCGKELNRIIVVN